MRAIIQSEKHIVQYSPTVVEFGNIELTNLAVAKHVVDATDATEIEVGTSVKAVYVEVWLTSTTGQESSTIVSVEKIVGTGVNMSHANSVALHTYPNKRNIFYVSQGLLPDTNGNPVPFIRQWVLIPKGKQRFGLGDKLRMNITGLTGDVNFCGLAIYLAKT